MTAGAVGFVTLIYREMRGFPSSLEDRQAFLGAEFARSGTEGLDARHGVALPEEIDLHSDEVFDFLLVCLWRNHLAKVVSERIRSLLEKEETSGVLHMLLDSGFDLLLRVSDILFTSENASCLVHNNLAPAISIVDTLVLLPAVAGKLLKV